jgi:hypothetical protein
MTKRILLLLSTLGVAFITTSGPQAQGCISNPIVCENNLPGNSQGEWDVSGAGDSSIQGFATDISVNRGGTVHFKVSTTAATFSVDIYRIGYYGGMGARKVASLSTVTGRNQPACLTNSTTFLVDCGNWTESTLWNVPATAVSGVYVAKLTRSDTGGKSHIPFVIRNDASTSDILFQTSDTTWQAYNQYGGYSVYQGSPQAAYKVSYNRPFATRGQTSGYGTSNYLFYAEYPMIRWLESNGYDVSYFTGVDADRFGSLIQNHKAFLSVGHDEYWSGGQRNNVEAARNAGVNLAFFSGNEIFWKTRWENSTDGSNTPYRTLVTYKETHFNQVIDPADPPTWTGTWADPRFSPPADGGRPQNALTGQFFAVNRGTTQILVPSAYKGLRFWRNTAIAQLGAGQTATLSQSSLGYEWDVDADNGVRPPGTIDMSATTVAAPEVFVDWGTTVNPVTVTHNLTLYRHPSGALVFGAGTVQWAWGLDPNHDTVPDTGSPTPDLNMQQATMNLLGDMGAQPATRQANLFPAPASTDVAPPTSTITSPANGASIAAESSVSISGTAVDSGGGVVGGIEVSTDGGATWHRANGTSNWTYNWRPGVLGTINLLTRATDDSGNIEPPSAGINVNISTANCPCSLWTPSAVPWQIDQQDGSAVEIGTKFTSDLGGQIQALRFYKAPGNTGTHTGHLWTASGTLLGSLTFTNETASGWQQTSFATPIPINAGQTYVASYHTNVGHYSTDSYYFGKSGVDQWPLHAPSSPASGGNGLYVYSSAAAFPNNSYQGENYWVDVVIGPLDTTPPTVSITSPTNNAALNGTVTLTANAADNISVLGVQFKLDGVNLGAEDTASPYTLSWNTASAGNGTHQLTAVARDQAGNQTTSAPITVSVFNPDTFPPTVSMTAPANGAVVAGNITLSANATDNNGVVGLQFLLDGANLGAELTTGPYSVVWNSTPTANGPHTLGARARDAAGNTTTNTINVTLANGAPLFDATVFTDKASSTGTTIASPAFSTTAPNELLLAFIGSDDQNAGQTVTGITGGGLTWTLVRRTNASRGDSEVWRAFATSALTNVTVTATLGQAAAASLTVVSFKNVDTSGTNGSGAVGATGSGNSTSGLATATLTATRTNSWVFGVGNDWNAGAVPTPGANQTMVHAYLDSGLVTAWVQRTSGTSTAGASVTINDTAPTARYNLTTVEVLPPSVPTFSVSGTVSPLANATGTTLALSGAAAGSTTVDASGNYSFVNLTNGTYTITPSKTGFTFTPASQTVTVSGGNLTAVNFAANPLPKITGTITNGASSTVTLSGTASATTTADGSGNYSFTGLLNGSYTVTPSKTGFIFTPANQTVTVNGADVTANFTANPLPKITGTITTGAGSTVTLSGMASATTTADGSGNYSFTGLANGSYTVTPSKTGLVFTPANQTVTVSGADVTGVNFTANPIPTYSISGAVSPLPNGPGTTLTLSGSGSGTQTADASGNFSFSGLPNGTYTVTPSKTGFVFTPTSQTVAVNNANVPNVNFTVSPIPTYSISGTVGPIANGPGTTLVLSGGANTSMTADASGNFSFSGLSNGTYTVTPSKAGFTFTPANQTVTVSNANVTAVNFTANAIPTYTISGSVSPVANGAGTTLTLSGSSSGTVTADGSGNYTFSGLVSGTYTVTPSKTGFVFTPANQSVTINSASSSSVNFTIAPAPTGLAMDVQISADQGSTSVSTVTTPTFSTTAGNELLLAFVTGDYLSGPNTTVTSMTGGGLTWQLVIRQNTQPGNSEIWRAFSAVPLSNVTVSATLSQPATASLTVVSFTGVDTSGTAGSGAIGATKSDQWTSGQPAVQLTTTRNNSWVFGVGNDYDNPTARTLGPNQTMVHQYFTPTGDTYWVQRQNAPTPTAGTLVTINDTAPTTDRWNMCIVEILPAPGS